MATTRGCMGLVKIGTNDLAEVRSWSFDETAEQIDTSVMGDCTKKYDAGAVATTGTVQCWWDPSDTDGQGALTPGAKVDLELFPGGDSSGLTKYSGNATVTSVSRSSEVDGIVQATFGFGINGALTSAPVP